jgi:hypothetical protein
MTSIDAIWMPNQYALFALICGVMSCRSIGIADQSEKRGTIELKGCAV